MTHEELQKVLADHAKWLRDEKDGKRAYLTCTYLRGADLTGADLTCTYLRGADLTGADLTCTYLRGAYLRGAYLRGAYLTCADLRGADLTGADLTGAYLTGAQNIPAHTAAQLMACPEEGAFIGWKKCANDVIVKLSIPTEARRSSATNRKCRAEFVDVLEVFGAKEGVSQWDDETTYRAGERVHCKTWDEDRWNECSGGIHFFITRCEAENH